MDITSITTRIKKTVEVQRSQTRSRYYAMVDGYALPIFLRGFEDTKFYFPAFNYQDKTYFYNRSTGKWELFRSGVFIKAWSYYKAIKALEEIYKESLKKEGNKEDE